MSRTSLISICSAMILVSSAAYAAEPHPDSGRRVGVYDSRVVSYAFFNSAPAKHDRNALISAAKAAREAGDTKQLSELKTKIGALQRQSMLEVFSIAPADEAMAALKEKLPAIQWDLGVDGFVSKWDEKALKGIPEQDRVEATDRLVRAFFPRPNEYLRNMVSQIEAAKPLPLWEAKVLCLFGSM
jgi:hypothetical protein